VIGTLALLDPDTRPMAAAWLLPTLALTLATMATLATMTVLTPRRSAAVVTVTWFVIVSVVQAVASGNLAAFGVIGQVVALVVVIVAGGVVGARRDRFDRLEYLT